MFKRFHDVEKWDRPWFRKLTPANKCLWDYITSRCDNVGVWIPDFEMAEVYIGTKIDVDDFLGRINDNIVILENGYLWIKDFCAFQYGVLSELSRPHASYIKLLTKYGLIDYVETVTHSSTAKSVRSRLTKRIREDIYTRDRGACQYCGCEIEYDNAIIDHFIPISKGGNGDKNNLVLSCVSCNAIKSDFMPIDFASRHIEYKDSIDRVSRFLETLSTFSDSAKDKDKDNDKEKDCNIKSKKESKTDRTKLPGYGIGETVHLSDSEHEKLIAQYGKMYVEMYVKKMSLWEPTSGKRHKDDYKAMLRWMDKDKIPTLPPPAPKCEYCGLTLIDGLCHNAKCPQYEEVGNGKD